MIEDGKYLCPFCNDLHDKSVDLCPLRKLVVQETHMLEGEIVDGKYKLGEKLGVGGMGVVYKAEHMTIGRPLAIKFLHVEMQTSETVAIRFQNEARAAASVGHQNIVDIIDMGKFRDKLHYIVMEFIEGRELKDIMNTKGKLPVHEAVEITMQILSGLRAVHAKKILHRDLKPDNIFVLLDMDGELSIKIVDFGICRIHEEALTTQKKLTQEGMVCGTPIYMSPEHARGRSDMDHRADLYSASAILYEMVTGVPPLDAESVGDLLYKIVSEEPKPAHELEPAVPPELSRAIMKGLAKKPEDRYQDANEFMDKIGMFASPHLNEMLRKRHRKSKTFSIPAELLTGNLDDEISVSVELDEKSLSEISMEDMKEEIEKAKTQSLPAIPAVQDAVEPKPEAGGAEGPKPEAGGAEGPKPEAREAEGAKPEAREAQGPKDGEPKQTGEPEREGLPTVPPSPRSAPAFVEKETTTKKTRVVDVAGDDDEYELVDLKSKTASRRSRAVLWTLALLLVLVAGGAALYYFYSHGLNIPFIDSGEGTFTEYEWTRPGEKGTEKPQTPSEPEQAGKTVSFVNLPGNAKVFINGILHAERPVQAPVSNDPQVIIVEVDGVIIHTEETRVDGDLEISLEEAPAGAGEKGVEEGEEGENESVTMELPGAYTVNFDGLLKPGIVYVDNVKHDERPVVVESSEKPYHFVIKYKGKVVFDEEFIVNEDMEIPVKMKAGTKKRPTKKTKTKGKTTKSKKSKFDFL
jgi:serine/threonine protein kinase